MKTAMILSSGVAVFKDILHTQLLKDEEMIGEEKPTIFLRECRYLPGKFLNPAFNI